MKSEERQTKPDIVARTFTFSVAVVKFCRSIGRSAGGAKPLVNQLLRSGTSVGANVEEAQAAQSKRDFLSKMQIELKEARESVYWLRLLRESGVAAGETVDSITREAIELNRILGAIIVGTKRNMEKQSP